MDTAQKQQLIRVFDSYDQMTNMRKLAEEKRRAERERFFNRFDGLRENTIDPELNELAEAIKARGHHAEVCETPRSEQSSPAVQSSSPPGHGQLRWPACRGRSRCRRSRAR